MKAHAIARVGWTKVLSLCLVASTFLCGQANAQAPTAHFFVDGQSSSGSITVTAGESVVLLSDSEDNDEGGCCIVQTDWYLNNVSPYFYRGITTNLAFHDSLSTQTLKLIIKDDEGQYGSKTVSVTVLPSFERQYYITDHLGSVRATVTQDGEVVHSSDYYPFGLEMPGRSHITSFGAPKERFTGHEKDEETADYYAGARYLDPVLGRWMGVDPMAHLRSWVSPYNSVQNNPVNRIDPTGALDDWVRDADGNIKWDKDANSQVTTKPGETYLGKSITFTFNSYIDGTLWDGPGGSAFAGDKLTSTISITGNENEAGELTSLSARSSVRIGRTPIGTPRDHFPGLGTDQNKFGFTGSQYQDGLLTSTTLHFEQHASVSPIEAFGLNLMGYDIVNVAQNLQLNLSGNRLSVTAATDVFPSATLAVNGIQLFTYNQPSFKGTHGYVPIMTVPPLGSFPRLGTPLRPDPSFYTRYSK